MKKLVFVAVLLVAVLGLSWWAKTVNFNFSGMMKSINLNQNQGSSKATLGTQTEATITPTSVPVEIFITLTPSGFVPNALMISANTRITWVNKATESASIASDPKDAYTDLNLGAFDVNNSVSLTFPKSGRYNYVNESDPSQKGVIIVK